MTTQILVGAAGMAYISAGQPAAPDADIAVLEVAGGHLCWSVLDLAAPPTAYLDDVDIAQDWVWAIYGEPVAVALATAGSPASFAPARPESLDDAALLAFALWAQRWWPSSVIDAIPALDPALLAADIASLRAECDGLLDDMTPAPDLLSAPARPESYALAAGAEHGEGLMLARGTGGTDWRAYPPGLIDASEAAVSWELIRSAGHTQLALEVAAAPELSGPVPAHLRPVAQILAGGAVVPLELAGDRWTGTTDAPDTYEPIVAVRLPGFGADQLGDPGAGLETRVRIRQLVRDRLGAAGTAEPGYLLAEMHAATSGLDY